MLKDPGKTSPLCIAFGAPYTSLWCAAHNQEPSFLHSILFLISTWSGRFPQGMFTCVLGSPLPGPLCLYPLPMTFSLPVNNSNCLNYHFFIFWDYRIIASWHLVFPPIFLFSLWPETRRNSILSVSWGSVFPSLAPSNARNHCLHSQWEPVPSAALSRQRLLGLKRVEEASHCWVVWWCHCQLDTPSIICKETLSEGLSRSDRPVQVSVGDCLDGLKAVVLNL